MYMFIVVKYVYVHMHQYNITCIYIYTSSLILYIHPVTTAQPPIRCDPSRFAPAKITLMTKGYPFFTKISSSHQTKRKKKTSSIWGIKSLKVQTSFSWEPGTPQVPDSKRLKQKHHQDTETSKSIMFSGFTWGRNGCDSPPAFHMLFTYGQPKKTRSKQIYTESEKIDGTWLTCVLCAKFTSHHSGSGHHHHHHLLGSTGRPDVPRRNCLNVARRERVDARVVPPNVQEGHPFARFCGGGGSVGYLIYSRHIKQWFPLRRPY